MILNPKKIKFLQRNRTSITIKHTNESTVVVSSVFKAWETSADKDLLKFGGKGVFKA